MLLTIITRDQQQARDNCSGVETLRTPKSLNDSIDIVLNFSPLDTDLKHLRER